MSKSRPTSKGGSDRRSAARLGAVQAIYQIEQSGEDVVPAVVISEFVEHRLGHEVDGLLFAEADVELFGDIVAGVAGRRAEIDQALTGALSKKWKLGRLEMIMGSILRCGTYELMARPDVPTAVVINEYMDVAHAFYPGDEPAFVNGVLDRLAKELRG
jgi:N utilization substance protein B